MANATFDIDAHSADPYLSDWYADHAAGKPTTLEEANHALLKADLAATIIGERGDDLDKAQAEAIIERAALAASACARAVRADRPDLASAFAKQANSEALVLSSFSYVNVG
jgi:hypothetical protein